jgi:hypothetical protein
MPAEDHKSEIVTLIYERPMVALELGLMAEEDFVRLMNAVHRRLRQQSMISLGSLNMKAGSRSRSMQDILDLVKNVRAYGI